MGTPLLIGSWTVTFFLYAAGWFAFWAGAIFGWRVDRESDEGIAEVTFEAMGSALLWPAIVAWMLLATALRLIARMFAA